MARADNSLPQDWFADERAEKLEEEAEQFSDADLDEMLARLEPEQRTFLLQLPRFSLDLNESLRVVLGGWNYRGLYLRSTTSAPVYHPQRFPGGRSSESYADHRARGAGAG